MKISYFIKNIFYQNIIFYKNMFYKISYIIKISYFIKIPYFYKNTSRGKGVATCGQTDITKLTVIFRNFANAPNNGHIFLSFLTSYIPVITKVQPGSRIHAAF